MVAQRDGLLEGWRLVGIIGAATLALVLGISIGVGGGIEGVRLAIRATARTSVVLFLMAFVASSLVALAPGAFTKWQLRNRRYLGVSFAVSHLVHAVAIVTLFRGDETLFWTLTSMFNVISGSITYLFIIAMAATSFDRTAAWLGPKRWAILHKAGVWVIWGTFLFSFGKRIPQGDFYWLPVAALLVALMIRVIAAQRRRQRRVVA